LSCRRPSSPRSSTTISFLAEDLLAFAVDDPFGRTLPMMAVSDAGFTERIVFWSRRQRIGSLVRLSPFESDNRIEFAFFRDEFGEIPSEAIPERRVLLLPPCCYLLELLAGRWPSPVRPPGPVSPTSALSSPWPRRLRIFADVFEFEARFNRELERDRPSCSTAGRSGCARYRRSCGLRLRASSIEYSITFFARGVLPAIFAAVTISGPLWTRFFRFRGVFFFKSHVEIFYEQFGSLPVPSLFLFHQPRAATCSGADVSLIESVEPLVSQLHTFPG